MKHILLRAIAASLAFAVLALAPAAASDSAIIPLSSGLYEVVDDLYALSGYSRAPSSRPWSAAEARQVLERVEVEVDVEGVPGQELLRKAWEILDEEGSARWTLGDTTGLGARLAISPEAYAHTNTEDFRTEEKWALGYDVRAPFLHLGLEFAVDDFFFSYADLMYTVGRYSALRDHTLVRGDKLVYGIGSVLEPGGDYIIFGESFQYYDAFSTNFLHQSAEFEFEWPRRAYISLGGDKWSFEFGRDQADWGNSSIGNLVIDSHVPYHDLMRLKFFTPTLTWDWTTLFFDTRQVGAGESVDNEVRMLLAHRLEFRPARWISFAVSENVMYQAPTLSLQYLNPAFIYHNLNNAEMFNAIASAEVNVTPIPGLSIYAQAVLDQARAPNEGDSQADSWGILGGVEGTFALGKNVASVGIEAVYASPMLYRRDRVDFLMYVKEFTMDASHTVRPYYIGFPYGGDIVMLRLSGKIEDHGLWKAGLDIDAIAKGAVTMTSSHNKDGEYDGKANITGAAPSGDNPDVYFVATLSGGYEVPGLPDWMALSFNAAASFVQEAVWNKPSNKIAWGSSDFQFLFGLSLEI